MLEVHGDKGLASLGPYLGAPADPGAGTTYWGHGVRGLASPRGLGHAVADSAAWCRLRRLWKTSHIFYAQLDSGYFNELVVSDSHLPRCSHVSLRLLLDEFHTLAASRGKSEHYFYEFLVFSGCDFSVQCLAIQRIHVLLQSGSLWWLSTFSTGWLIWILWPILVLLSCVSFARPRSLEKCIQLMLQLLRFHVLVNSAPEEDSRPLSNAVFLPLLLVFTQNGEVCTDDASAAQRSGAVRI